MSALSGRRIAALLGLFALIFLVGLPGRELHVDDAWLGEQAYWLATDGVPRSELFAGTLGYEDRIWVFHRLWIAIGAGAVNLGGWSAVVLKSVSLPFLLATLALLWWAQRERSSRRDAGLGLLLLFAHPLAQEFGYVFRPEIMLGAVGLASWILLRRHLDTGSRRAFWGSAILAGIGVLVHLHGLMFVVAGASVLLVERRLRAAPAYLALSLAVGALYVADVALADAWDPFWQQLVGDPVLSTADPALQEPLSRLAREPHRWLHRGEGVGLTLLLVASLWAASPSLRREQRALLVYLTSLVLALALGANSTSTKYLIPLLPIACLWIAAAVGETRRRASECPRRALVLGLALFAYLGASLVSDLASVHLAEPAAQRHARIAEHIRRDPTPLVLAPLRFIFDELPRLRIHGLLPYRWAERARGVAWSTSELLTAARESGATHVLLEPGAWDVPRLPDLEAELELGHQESRLVVRQGGLLLFEVDPP